VKYSEILKLDLPSKLVSIGNSLRMEKHDTPISISEIEFRYLQKDIIENDLKCGYECGTAFGVSSLAAGLGMLETGGTIITLDTYVEESLKENNSTYAMSTNTYFDTMGHKIAVALHSLCGVGDIVKCVTGHSPSMVNEILSGLSIDYVFIDGNHIPKQIILDATAVLPFINIDKCHLFFHDCHTFTNEVHNFFIDTFGKDVEVVIPRPAGFNLGVIRLEEER